jgi:two-component system cell cycle response regulator CtrA
MRVLVVEDDQATAKTIQMSLQSEGFICDFASTGEDGLEMARHYDYDLIMLDLVLPDISGYEILKRLRAVQISTPVLILSGLSDISDKKKGLDIGGDDYLTKPFNREEMIARVRAIIRRSKGHHNSVISVGRLKIDLNKKSVSVENKTINLTSKEYSVIELLGIRKGTTLSKEVFLNHLYGGMEEPEFKIIDVFICKLRKKLSEALDGENYIETVWGRGYVLREPSKDDGYTSKNTQHKGAA